MNKKNDLTLNEFIKIRINDLLDLIMNFDKNKKIEYDENKKFNISIENAKLLLEKNIFIETKYSYKESYNNQFILNENNNYIKYENILIDNFGHCYEYPAPTFIEIQQFFIKNKKLYINVIYDQIQKNWGFRIQSLDNEIINLLSEEFYLTFEEAFNNGISKIINLL